MASVILFRFFLKFWHKVALVHRINEFKDEIRTSNIFKMAAKIAAKNWFLALNSETVHQIESKSVTKKVQN